MAHDDQPPNPTPKVTEDGFRLLVEQVVDYAIFLIDTTGHVVTWNAGAQRIKGYTAKDIVGQHISKFYRPEDTWKVAKELDVATREGRVEDEGWRVRKDGTLFWANVVITAIRDGSGKLAGFAKVTRDLTERRGAEEVLRQSEERFRLLVESVKDYAIFMLDPNGIVATWNIGAQRFKGYLASEIIGQHFSRFYPEADVRAGKCDLELEIAARDGRFEDEGWRIRKDGTRFWANVVITALRNAKHELVGFAKVTRDLTDRKQAEEERLRLAEQAAAHESAERLITLLTRLQRLTGSLAAAPTPTEVANVLVNEGTAALDATMGFVVVVAERQRLHLVAARGAPDALVGALEGMSVDARVPAATAYRTASPQWLESAEDYAREASDFPATVPAAGSVAALPLVVRGSVIAVVVFRFAEPRVFAPDERALMATFTTQAAQALDRAEVFAKELATRRRVEALGGLAEALSGALTVDDVARIVMDSGMRAARADTCTLYALDDKTGALELLVERGCSPGVLDRIRRITADSGNPVYPTIANRESLWAETVQEYAAFYPSLATMQADGNRAHAFWSVPMVAEGRTIGLLAMGYYATRRFPQEERDFVTTFTRQCAEALLRARRLETERSLYASEQRARQSADVANRAKDEFLAMVSHELRTPLNAIMGWAKMMAGGGFDEARRDRAVNTIERNAVAMAQLIEDLLDISRIISGKMRLEVQQVDLARIIESAIDSVKPAADAKGIHFTAVIDTTLPAHVGDPTRLQQIVWNLLSNAVKFTSKDGRVDVILTVEDSWAQISVTDTGKGIAPDFLPHVFDAFRQEDASFTRSRGGLGLGLAITRQLVELHGGRIEAQSEGDGRGATFIVRLPIAAIQKYSNTKAAGSQRAAGADAAFEPPIQLRGLRVLVVDDEDDARQLIKAILEQCACIVRVAGSVEEALSELAKEVPDILLSDIGMPGQDGYELIRRVRELAPDKGGDIPAAALTAYARAEDRRRMLNAGYSMHVPKPVEPAELAAVVASLTRFSHRIGRD